MFFVWHFTICQPEIAATERNMTAKNQRQHVFVSTCDVKGLNATSEHLVTNGCIIWCNTFAFWSCVEGGGWRAHKHFPTHLSQGWSRLTITPTHMLERTRSTHLSQNAISTSAHLNLPTYRFCAATHVGLLNIFLYNTVWMWHTNNWPNTCYGL